MEKVSDNCRYLGHRRGLQKLLMPKPTNVLTCGVEWGNFPRPDCGGPQRGTDAIGDGAKDGPGLNALLFVGTYEHTIDAKQRLAIPGPMRDEIDKREPGSCLYAVVQEGPMLCLYTEKGFEKRAEELDRSTRPAEEVLAYEQVFYSMAQRLEIDKQGRVRVPERLLELAGLQRNVTLIGVKDHMQVHDRDHWTRKVQQMLAERPGLLANPRKVMA